MNFKNLKPKDYNFAFTVASRWRDMDAIGHINNETILSYFEDVRVRYLSSLSIDINSQSESNSVILASMKIDYYHQVNYPDIFDVGCRIIRVGTKSYDLLSSIFLKNSDKTLVSGLFTIVCFDYVEQKTIVVPDIIKNQLNPIVDKI